MNVKYKKHLKLSDDFFHSKYSGDPNGWNMDRLFIRFLCKRYIIKLAHR